ncbi:MAG: hypothetical protein JXO48_10460 [Deltaproteobacteria bacterium]|nr:hypothetical protein [Deltaproteobacteria bacterium]
MTHRFCRHAAVFLLCFLLLMLLGCAASSPAKKGKPGDETGRHSIAGIWKSHIWGSMILKQSGDQVWGTYDYNQGQLRGVLEGDRFSYRWWELVPHRSYEQAFKNHRGDGYFDLSDDGKKLEGKWRLEGVEEWGGDWFFRRIR